MSGYQAYRSERVGLRLLALLGIPFAAFGTWALVSSARVLWSAREVRSWREVPARVLSAEVQTTGGGSSRGRAASDLHEAKARYEYVVDDVKYFGERVGLLGGGDDVDAWAFRVVDELRRAQRDGKQVRAWVDPDDPTRAILRREIRWNALAFRAGVGAVLSLLGFGMIAVSRLVLRRLLRLW